VALAGGKLYIAMAGSHQIWVLDLKTLAAEAWIGSGAEDIVDGVGLRCSLAQPSGLTVKGEWLYFVDSEVSAVRKANLKTREVETLIGTGLFDFGDRTGPLRDALLQHPLCVTVSGDDILVADTYNHKIKRVSESRGNIRVVAPADSRDIRGEQLSLHEPGGLSAHGDSLYIADTNHDRIVVFDLRTGQWHTFDLHGLLSTEMADRDLSELPLQDVPVRPRSDLTLHLTAEFAPRVHLNLEAPLGYSFAVDGDTSITRLEGVAEKPVLPLAVTIPASSIRDGKEYRASLSLAYCTDDNRKLCVPVTLTWRVRFVPDAAAPNFATLASRVEALP